MIVDGNWTKALRRRDAEESDERYNILYPLKLTIFADSAEIPRKENK